MRFRTLIFLLTVFYFSGCKKNKTPETQASPAPVVITDEWNNLLDKDLSHWERFIGVPHYSIKDLPDHPKGDGMNGTPLGLNNDPLNVFKTETIDNELRLHISGEIYGGLTTKNEYSNFHLKLDFKWGEKTYEPRLGQKRDNGILYHCYGAHGAFWNVWMASHEFQVQEEDMGDYFSLGPAADIRAVLRDKDGEHAWIYEPDTSLSAFGDAGISWRCRRSFNMEKPHGEWNTFELICLGYKSIHVVNGTVVMVLHNSRMRNSSGTLESLHKGRIQIQSEAAEAWYRNMMIRSIDGWPEEYKSAVK